MSHEPTDEGLLESGAEELKLAIEAAKQASVEKAVIEGAAAAYDIHHPDYEWVPVQRYMGIFHEVQPAKNALKCNDCHGSEGRLDWKALGYGRDPRKKK